MAAVTRTIEIRDIKPEEVARMFCDMCSDEQAEFFNEVGRISAEWIGGGLGVQLRAILDAPGLKLEGRHVLRVLADHEKAPGA